VLQLEQQVLLVLLRPLPQVLLQLEQQVLLVLLRRVLQLLLLQVLQEPLAPQNCRMQSQPQ
jgi:hypothetical protein